jgi:Tfp pilus assembly protein PilE
MREEKLTENFYLSEFVRSETAARLAIDNTPDDRQLANLRRNAFGMQQVRNVLGHSVHVSSGLRVLALNRAIGSKDTSAHVDGRATDFVCPGFGSPADVCRLLVSSDMIAFDQLILEHTWVHIAWAEEGAVPRRQVLTLMPGNTYALGLHERSSLQAGFGVVHAIAAVAIVGALTALALMAKNYIEGVREDGVDAGRRAALLEVAQRDNTQLAAVQKRVLELQAELAEREQRHQAEVARIDQEGTDALRKVETERDAARRRATQYAGRLRDPGTRPADGCGAGDRGDGAAAAVAGAGVDPGEARAPGGELSAEAGGFLRAEADRADEVAHEHNALAVRLEACQAIVVEDRRG